MDILKIGQRLSIAFEKEENFVEIICKITDILEDRVVVELPQYFMRYIEFLDVGKPLTVKVFSKIGTIDFNTVIITSPLESNFSFEYDYNAIKLNPADEIPMINVVKDLILSDGEEVIKTRSIQLGITKLKLSTSRSLEVDKIYNCTLNLGEEYGIIKFSGIVTYKDLVYDDEYDITYSTISEDIIQKLLYYMYLVSNDND